MKYIWIASGGLLIVSLLLGWGGCFSVPVPVTNIFTMPEMTWTLSDHDQAIISAYWHACQHPWQARRPVRLLPDIDTRC